MKAVSVLPDGYREYYTVDLQKDKKAVLIVNALAVVIGAAMVAAGCLVVPIGALFSMEDGLGAYSLRFAALLGLMLAYIVLHELVHGAAMKLCGTKKITYGFTGMYAFAGSEDHYDKSAYIFIALAPVVLWGIVIALVNPFVPAAWFWVVYFLQIVNISGAAGDIFVTVKFLRFPGDILVRDCGVRMAVYSRQED